MQRKAQAAMEFLMTYGWAILVVIAAIAALAYYGVLSPSKFLPEKCVLPSGIACLDAGASQNGFTLVLKNGAGFDTQNVVVSVAGTGCSEAATGPAELKDGNQGTYIISCSPASGQYRGTLSMQYTRVDTGVAHNATGELVKKIP